MSLHKLIVSWVAGCWLLVVAAGYSWAASADNVGDAARGKAISKTCAECHGADGNSSVELWPKLAGQYENYLFRELVEYKKGEQGLRYDPSMASALLKVSERDMRDLSAFFAQQKISAGKTPKNFLELGRKIYKGGNIASGVPACSACHSPNGDGNRFARIPKLGGQHAAYVADQLKKYRSGQRQNGINGIMQAIAVNMTDDEIEAVSNYVSGLH